MSSNRELTAAEKAELTGDMIRQFGITESTARKVVDVHLQLLAHYGETRAEKESAQVVQEAYLRGETWAKEYFRASTLLAYQRADVIHRGARAAGTDPVPALRVAFGISQEMAAELAKVLVVTAP